MSMWPFFRQNKKSSDRASMTSDDFRDIRNCLDSPRRPLAFQQLLQGMDDFKDLGRHDVAVKFWLPLPVAEALRELRSHNGQSISEFVRQFLAIHCYGIYAYQLMLEQQPDLFRDYDDMVRFSLREEEPPPGKKRVTTYFVPELGKNVAPLKVWMAGRLRNDLKILADHVGLKLSHYLREIVISRLLGHGTLPMRPAMLGAQPTLAAEDWCDGREVPWREVNADEYFKVDERRSECDLVDDQ